MTADPAELNVVRQQFARLGVEVPAVRAALSADHAGRPPRGCWPTPAPRRQPSAAACSTTMSATRGGTTSQNDNQGRGVRARRPLAGLVHPDGADSPGDRRQADPVAHRLGDPDGRDDGGSAGQGRRRHVPAASRSASRRLRPDASSRSRRSVRPCRRRPTRCSARCPTRT